MSQNLKLLIIEDVEDDALLTVYKLTSSGFTLNWKRIQSENELLRELREPWDIIISDYLVPNYSALNGLLIVRDLYPDLPFIIVSGAIGEEAAVELMKRGADDYLLKDNLAKLPQVIRRELEDYKMKVEKRKAEKELRESEERYSLALNSSEEGIWDWDLKTGVKNFSPGYFQLMGIEIETDPTPPDFRYDLIHPEDKNAVMSAIRDCVKGDKTSYLLEYRVQHSTGKWIWILGKCRVVNRNSDGSAARMVGTNLDITKNKISEFERRESEERLKTLVDTIPDGILMVNMNYTVKWTNKNLLGLLHFDDYDEVIGKNLFPEVCLDPKGKGQSSFTKCLSTGKPQSLEYELGRLNGTRIYVEMSVALIKNYRHEPEYFLVVFRDITDRKSYESMIKKFSVAINSSSDTIFITDALGHIEYVNPAFERTYGYTQDEVIGKTPRILKSGKYGQDYYLRFWVTILAGKTYRAEIINLAKNGDFIFEDRVVSPIKNDKGEIINFISVGRDIGDKLKTEKQVKESEQKFKGVFEQSFFYSAIISRDGTLQDINDSFLEFTGMKRDRIIGKNLFDSLDEVASPEIKHHLVNSMEAATQNKPNLFYWSRMSGPGRLNEAEFSLRSILDDSGEIAFFLIQGLDLNARTEYLEKVKETESKYETLVKNLPSVVYRRKNDSKFSMEYMGGNTEELFGYTSEDFISGKTTAFIDVVHEDDKEFLQLMVKKALDEKQPFRCEYRIISKNGETKWIQESGKGIYDNKGKAKSIEGILTEITEKKRLLEELISAKNAAEELNNMKDTFIANVSHELRTPLVGLLGYSEFLAEQLTGFEKNCAELVHHSGVRLLGTISDLLDFSEIKRKQIKVEYNNLKLDKLVKEEAVLYAKIAEKKGLQIKTELEVTGLYLMSDENLLRQVIDNLLDNAIKFTNEGTITVLLSREDRHAVIKIIDTGIGIPPEKVETIFEDFRQVSEGSARIFQGLGLGLTIVKKNLHALKGVITVSSQPDMGSVFTVMLPLDHNLDDITYDTKAELENTVLEWKSPEVKKKAKVLIVEDDKINRSILTLMLENHYEVDSAINAENALEVISEKDFDVILMDINLGEGKNGAELAHELRQTEKYRNKAIIALTAYAMPYEKEMFLKSGCSHYMAKPFRSAELIELINSVLGGIEYDTEEKKD